jgi:serine/threonine protein kinase
MTSPTTATPQKIGRYEIREEIGRGAMGVVYRARDPIIGRDVAIKVLRGTVALPREEFDQFRHRFIREAQSAGILSHPNIVTVHDVVEESPEGFTFIAMEYVPGTNLRQLLHANDGLAIDRALELLLQVASALDFAHSKGVVHRDIKPANILITDDHKVKITDFGIARMDASNLTQDGQLLGTPNYMAPEQILGNEVDHRADLFSLGVVLYETLTRQKPFPGENLTAVAHRVVYEPFTPPEQHLPDLPKAINAILIKALEKDPAMRYQRGSELAGDMRRALDDLRNETTSVTLIVGDRTASGARRMGMFSREIAETAASTPVKGPAGAKAAKPGKPSTNRSVPSSPAASPSAASPSSASAKQRPTGPSAAVAAGAPGATMASERRNVRLVVGSFLFLTVALFAGLGVLALRAPEPAVVAALPPAVEEPAGPTPFELAVADGQKLLASGNASAAVVAFARAEALDPNNPAARTLRLEAERQAAPPATPAPVAAPVAPTRAARTTPAPAPPPPIIRDLAPAPAPAPAEPVSEIATTSELEVDLYTEISPGVLTVYVGKEQVLRETFRFQRRAGLGRASVPGSVNRRRTVKAGDNDLRVIVALDGKPTKVLTVQGNLPGGKSKTLQIRIDPNGVATATLL